MKTFPKATWSARKGKAVVLVSLARVGHLMYWRAVEKQRNGRDLNNQRLCVGFYFKVRSVKTLPNATWSAHVRERPLYLYLAWDMRNC